MKHAQNIEVLLSEETLAKRTLELGHQITLEHQGHELCVIGILKGCFMFFADLVRHIDLPLHCEFMGISSYGNATHSSGVVQITSDLSRSIEGQHVLIVEDIIDTGLTMAYLLNNLATRKPASVQICTLLEKPDNAQQKVAIDYVGFKIPNAFVIGYGLDLAGLYRNLPFVGIYHGNDVGGE